MIEFASVLYNSILFFFFYQFVFTCVHLACVGGSDRPCHGNGQCDGDGTRRGSGKCTCDHGYEGEFCLECAERYYNEERNDTYSLCKGKQHSLCKDCYEFKLIKELYGVLHTAAFNKQIKCCPCLKDNVFSIRNICL